MTTLGALLRLLAALMVVSQLAACSNAVEWEEEVKLNDGRVIVVKQKRRCEGGDHSAKKGATCVAREAWLTLRLPEFPDRDIVWHEQLKPMVLNVHKGQLYVVGRPAHLPEFRAYGATNPPYFGFLWQHDRWQRIPFDRIPVEIYDTNMLIESIPKTRTRHLSLVQKNSREENGDSRYPQPLQRIDPHFTMQAY